MVKSIIWRLFRKLDNSVFVRCKLCHQDYKSSGNTSNLFDHAKRKHPIEFSRLQRDRDEEGEEDDIDDNAGEEALSPPMKRRTLKNYFQRQNKYSSNSQKKIKLDRLLVDMISTDLEPYRIVEHLGFKKFVNELDSSYDLPSRSYLKDKLVPDLYNQLKSKLMELLTQVEYVSLTTDLWTSPANEGIITITCHFGVHNQLKSAVLRTMKVEGHHTGQHISEVIEQILGDWNIRDKVMAVVTDNGANMVNAINLLRIRHIPCFAHTLNLLVTDILKHKDVVDVIKRCKDICTFFRPSTLAADKLRLQQERSNSPILKLLLDTPTRWNSTFYMIKRILEVRVPLTLAIMECNKAPTALNAEDYVTLENLVLILSPFEDATKEISGEQYVTISLIVPLICGMVRKFNAMLSGGDDLLKQQLVNSCLAAIQKRLYPYESNILIQLATIVDPRIKKLGFRTAEQANNANRNLVTSQTNKIRQVSIERKQANLAVDVDTQNIENQSLLSFLDSRRTEAYDAVTPTSDAIILVRQYLEKAPLSRVGCPIDYWYKYDNEIMKKVGFKFLCIPASSVPAERVFSKAGLFMTDR